MFIISDRLWLFVFPDLTLKITIVGVTVQSSWLSHIK